MSGQQPRLIPFFLFPALLLLLLVQVTGLPSVFQNKAPNQIRSFVVDASQSQIALLLIQEGMVRRLHPSHRVAVGTFSGSIHLPKDESKVSVEIEAVASSLTNVDKDMSDFERREFQKILHNSVLEVSRYPKIAFRSVSITGARSSGNNRNFTLNGDLTLHGQTRRVALPVSASISNEQVRASGEVKIKQSDFGMTPYSGGLGTIKIGDELKVIYSIVAKRSAK